MRFIKPLDESLLHTIFKTYSTLITIEDGVENGGFGSSILEFAATNRYKNEVVVKGIPDEFIDHASRYEMLEEAGLTLSKIKIKLQELL